MTEPIVLTDVSLAYRLARNRAGTLKEFAIQMVRRQVRYEQLWALKDVDLTIGRGEVLGVVGRNGAGKSTLLKVLARVLPPTEGRVVVRGMVAPLIELGAGFINELTGYENIVMYGSLLGREPKEMRERAHEIAGWAGVSDFVDVPLRSYSSGMLARLGFAIATDVDPEILLVDEVLAVGDAEFRRKSEQRMATLIEGGTTVVFVSHDLETMQSIAHRVIWLDKGRVVRCGDTADVIAAYRSSFEEGSDAVPDS